MAYIEPSEFVTKMVDAGEQKVYMSTKDTFIRAFMAGAILGLAAIFAITVATKTGSAILDACLFPVGFIMLYASLFNRQVVLATIFAAIFISGIALARTLGFLLYDTGDYTLSALLYDVPMSLLCWLAVYRNFKANAASGE